MPKLRTVAILTLFSMYVVGLVFSSGLVSRSFIGNLPRWFVPSVLGPCVVVNILDVF